MDFMKVLDQTVREIKREVNLKVLKVPEIEQKVLDATSDEPWGPHGTDLQELAQATKKFSDCQMIMNVLWTRLSETGANWRHVYKALTVIEYLVANGSERAVDNILEHSYKISSVSGFEYTEPNGKDVGINVRKKVENMSALLKDKDKMQEVRNKAAANRDKYFGLSSTGITYKSNTAGIGGGYDSDRYGSSSVGKDRDSDKYNFDDKERSDDDTNGNYANKSSLRKSRESVSIESTGKKSMKGATQGSKDRGSLASKPSKLSTNPASSASKPSSLKAEPTADDFDDFDPRGSSTNGSTNAGGNKVDLFEQSLVGDLLDMSAPAPATLNSSTSTEVDLFADSDFVSAVPHTEATTGSNAQENIDLFKNHAAPFSAFPTNIDLLGVSDPPLPQTKSPQAAAVADTDSFDPFAAVPPNNFEGSDLFGAFTGHADPESKEPAQSSMNNNSHTESSQSYVNASAANPDGTSGLSKPAAKKDAFQVKSSIWADSLSRGLIDLNITAPKKASLADIGVMGSLDDGFDDKDKGNPSSAHMGHAMGANSGYGWSGFSSAASGISDGGFSSLGGSRWPGA